MVRAGEGLAAKAEDRREKEHETDTKTRERKETGNVIFTSASEVGFNEDFANIQQPGMDAN